MTRIVNHTNFLNNGTCHPSNKTSHEEACFMSTLSVVTHKYKTCGLYYKHMTIVNDDSSVLSEQSL